MSNNHITKKLEELNKTQKEVLKLQKKLLKKENEIYDLEQRIYDVEEKNHKLHKKFEKKTKKNFSDKYKIRAKTNYKDVIKAVIGAFFGIMGHFAFAKGVDIAKDHSYIRSIIILLTAFTILMLFIYYSGFREVRRRYFLKILPIRATVLYLSAIFTVAFVLFLYGIIDFNSTFKEIFNSIASISIIAVLGAGTSDLIGAK